MNSVELVKTFSKLKDAQKYINQFPIDLMFSGYSDLRTNGMEFYKNLEKKIPVILLRLLQNMRLMVLMLRR